MTTQRHDKVCDAPEQWSQTYASSGLSKIQELVFYCAAHEASFSIPVYEILASIKMTRGVEDGNVLNVIISHAKRARHGAQKYGVTTERTDLSFLDWLTHAQEEAMDFAVYLERIKQELLSAEVKIQNLRFMH